MYQLSNINNTFESYQKLINFYQTNKDKQFEDIQISITNWFAANMCSAFGAILDILSNQHQIEWKWVKGHSGDPGNDRADALANMGIDSLSINSKVIL